MNNESGQWRYICATGYFGNVECWMLNFEWRVGILAKIKTQAIIFR